VQQSSGIPTLDRSAQRAVLASDPLPPLPSDYPWKRRQRQILFRVFAMIINGRIAIAFIFIARRRGSCNTPARANLDRYEYGQHGRN
jgi:hypothetical protein